MLFPTITFATFFLVVFLANWFLMPFPTRWRWFMLASSYFFYGFWNWRFVGLLVVSSLANQFFAVRIEQSGDERSRRAFLAGAVTVNLGLLGYFKYYGFFVESVNTTLDALGMGGSLPLIQVTLPVGISFFTFQALSYVIDIYRRKLAVAPPLDFAVYLAFFPQLVAGPIVRGTELLPQFKGKRDPRKIDASRAFYLIAIGLAKKVVIADFLASNLVDAVFASPGQYGSLEILVAIYAYSIQIYADFSAYSDIAIGVALLLGFRFPDNFNAPYTAVSIQDFWRRWHMTLSRWLRDYLYVPLGGNRGSGLLTQRNLMLTMLLGGLWHGAAWRFVIWGGLHGLWLVWERQRALRTTPVPDTAASLFRRRFVTFHLVSFAWIFFRAPSLSTAWEMIRRLATEWGGGVDAITVPIVLAIVVALAAQYVSRERVEQVLVGFSRLAPVAQGGVLALALFAIDALANEGVAAFIYFQF
ncbi:MAG: MBOAT family protein [Acidimicrobiia bacterium]|nr:MBOAT family protein [Acidimicrobiia bacterium]MBT8194142.1 MBOAT family protein [Acidimicrobiia bacterium]NNF88490.1 MBOAT family protein [Acidimicrobiia bacterium]NNJ48258.1 MBOAT family protein [Acidimicrobiia bacterium]NNL12062.1 MBOAT family protein [Acidimicrobiia bacterium]